MNRLVLHSFVSKLVAATSVALFSLTWLTSCQSTEKRHEPSWIEPSDGRPRVTVMAYNIENLFDTEDDPKIDDSTFLPLTLKSSTAHKERCAQEQSRYRRTECLELDWSEETVKEKMRRVAGAVLQVGAGRGPDVLIVEEVENQAILDRLRKEYLAAAGYGPAILIDGDDPRGIDVGMLTRLPVEGTPKLHRIPFGPAPGEDAKTPKKSRGILQTDLKLPNGDLLTVFGVHFPSPGNSPVLREQAIAHLSKLRDALPKGRMVVVGGDFNITAEEDAELSRYAGLAKEWLVSHHVGCKGCEGTHYFRPRKDWSFLDALLFSKNLDSSSDAPWRVIPDSIQTVRGFKVQTDDQGRPLAFENKDEPNGISDHLPLKATLELRPKP